MTALGVDDGFNVYKNDVMDSADTVLIGRRSYDGFAQYWPDREEFAEAYESECRFASRHNPMRKLVVTHHADDLAVPPSWLGSVAPVETGVAEVVRELKQRPGGDIVVWRRRDLWTHLAREELVDELHLVIGNGLARHGTSLFEPGHSVHLAPLSSHVVDESSCVVVRYRVEHS